MEPHSTGEDPSRACACPVSPNDTDEPTRHLLMSLIHRAGAGQLISDLVGPDLDEARSSALLEPVTRTGAVSEWLAVNGDRVDVVLTAGDEQRVVFGFPTGNRIDWLDVYRRPAEYGGVVTGRTIVVNGPSGAGKSTLLKALQEVATVPLVVLDEPEHIGTVQPEYLIWRDRAPTLHRGYLRAIGALARTGNHVAVSAAGHRQSEFIDAFHDVALLSVGLTCDPVALDDRERRTGRWGGIAADSLAVHHGWTYDLEFDTTIEPDPLEMAHRELDHLPPQDAATASTS